MGDSSRRQVNDLDIKEMCNQINVEKLPNTIKRHVDRADRAFITRTR